MICMKLFFDEFSVNPKLSHPNTQAPDISDMGGGGCRSQPMQEKELKKERKKGRD